jgi:hypothetical protein
MFVFAEERELRNGSIHCAHDAGLTTETIREATEPPPTFPFLESQSQRAVFRREFSFWQRNNTARKATPRAAWARCIGGLTGCVKRKKQNNFSACGWMKTRCFPRISIAGNKARNRYPMWFRQARVQGNPCESPLGATLLRR